MKLPKLATVVLTLVASMARANKTRPSSSMMDQQHKQEYRTTRRSLRRRDTSLQSCPCFNGTIIDRQVEVLQDSECSTDASDFVGLLGTRSSNSIGTLWLAFAGVVVEQEGSNGVIPACAFSDREKGFGSDIDPTNITSDELEVCQSILLESQMFATNNCTVVD